MCNQIAHVFKTDSRLKNWPDRWSPQPWQLFTTDGRPLETLTAAAIAAAAADQNADQPRDDGDTRNTAAIFLMFEGGQFIWPGIRLGYRRPLAVHDITNRQIVLETLGLYTMRMHHVRHVQLGV